MTATTHYTGLIEHYRKRLPVTAAHQIISLGEGNTPLIKLQTIPKLLAQPVELYVKYEGLNPTGSFKDRGMTMAVTEAVTTGARAIICASTGNTSASAAAYAARAGISAFVVIPEGKIAQGKLAQAMISGAVILQINGNFDEGMRIVKQLEAAAPVTIVNSINPYRLQGQKTAAFEIIDTLGRAPDFHCLPVGNAGNITAHWIGYREYATAPGAITTKACAYCNGDCALLGPAKISAVPKLLGYQAAGAAPFLRQQLVDNPDTIATAIRIGHPQSWQAAWTVQAESGGWFAECTDETILTVQKLLAEKEGIFCEPASAVAVAGAIADINAGNIPAGSCVVCTLTGHGMKDPAIAMQHSPATVINVAAELATVKSAIMDNIDTTG